MSRVSDVLLRWSEDASLREDLTDEEAAPLFAWAQSQLEQADAEAATDADFEARAGALRDLMKALNRTVGQRTYALPEDHAAQLAKAGEAAAPLGLPAPSEPLLAQADADGVAYMSALLAQFAPGAPIKNITEPAQSAPPASSAATSSDPGTAKPDEAGNQRAGLIGWLRRLSGSGQS